MHQFLRDILIARSWSIRYLSELAGLSYSGVRDYLHGHPSRLSQARLNRIYELLQLDFNSGFLKPNTLYGWRVTVGADTLNALNRVLRVMLEVTSTSSSGFLEPNNPHNFRFAAIPLIGGGSPTMPAPYCVLTWETFWLLIQWTIPAREQRKIGDFHSPTKVNQSAQLSRDVVPDLDQLTSALWAREMEVSPNKLRGIFLTPSQLTRLNNLDSSGEALSLSELVGWVQTETKEDTEWQSTLVQPSIWTWERIYSEIQLRYATPEQAAKALKLR